MRTTTRGSSSTSQTQDARQRQVEGNFARQKLPEDSNKRLKKKDYDRPDVIAAKNAELENFFKFNVIKSMPCAPRGAEVMRTTWVITMREPVIGMIGSTVIV